MPLSPRIANPDLARLRFGDLLDRLAPALDRADPLADSAVLALPRDGAHRLERYLKGERAGAPEALLALLDSVSEPPAWVDWDRIERAGRILFRSGAFGGIALGAKSLVHGYRAPAGNKPLAMTGRLGRGEVRHRLAETSRFVVAVCSPGGLRHGGQGVTLTLQVRLVHAYVRKMLIDSSYRTDLWGAPINQHDMMATVLLFSIAFLDGIRAFGIHVSPEEADDYVHLFRYVGRLMGVENDLLPATEREARRLSDFVEATQAEPDEDSRRLVRELVEAPRYGARTAEESKRAERVITIGYGFVRALQGDAAADALHVPKTSARHVLRTMRPLVTRLETLRRHVPSLEERAIQRGKAYWENSIAISARGLPLTFTPPSALRGLA